MMTRQSIIDTICYSTGQDFCSLYNADYVGLSKTRVCINYMRSRLITADAGFAYVFRCDVREFLSDQQNTLL